ncbi:TonB family protein [uncultured Fibrobacter sp.]|uniref:TonB family protein n=1 Tax=uncultured Fibrobacter sp. TaxID=261512 RepID=UPI0035A5D9D8
MRLRIDNAGKVLSATIIRRSGNRAMDASVEELVQDLKVLPNPPKAMEFVVTMEIDPW